MATIKMDVTEYQEMQKVAKLLEEAVKREEEYRKTIQVMQAEKIDILENNEKRVTIRNEVQSIETRSILVGYDEFKRNILFLADSINHYAAPTWSTRNTDNIAYARDVFERMFKTHTSEGFPEVSTTYKGFDDVKKKMKEDYHKEQTQETLDKLARAVEMSEEYNKIEAENIKLSKTVTIYKDKIEKLDSKNKYLNNRFNTFIKDIKKVIYKSINIFNYAQFKINIIKVFKSYE